MLLTLRLVAAALLAALIALAGVGAVPIAAQAQAMMLPVDATLLLAETAHGEKRFSVEIADDEPEREAGLMFRTQLPDDRGMLFVMDQTRDVSFWMKNTPLPLDLLFIGQDGKVKAIKHGDPMSEAIISPGEPVRFVLELKAGTAAKDGIEDGDLLVHPAITGAVGAGNGG